MHGVAIGSIPQYQQLSVQLIFVLHALFLLEVKS